MVRRGFPCCLCKKWAEEQFAYMREFNLERFGNQPCPECGRTEEKVVTLIDSYSDDHSKAYRKYISCVKCVPAMGDFDYIWDNDKVCHECFTKLKNEQEWTPQWSPQNTCQRPCKILENHCHRCGKQRWLSGIDSCNGACKGSGEVTTCKIEHVPSNNLEKNDGSVDLAKENQQLRQELAEVKNQLAQVLAELKKLKNNSSNKDSEKLEQQIVQNEKLIKDSENLSVAEVQEQVNKSQILAQEVKNVSTTFYWKSSKGRKRDNSDLVLFLTGSVAVVIISGLVFALLLGKRNERQKKKKSY